MGYVFINGEYLSLAGIRLIFSRFAGLMLAMDLGAEYHDLNDFGYYI